MKNILSVILLIGCLTPVAYAAPQSPQSQHAELNAELNAPIQLQWGSKVKTLDPLLTKRGMKLVKSDAQRSTFLFQGGKFAGTTPAGWHLSVDPNHGLYNVLIMYLKKQMSMQQLTDMLASKYGPPHEDKPQSKAWFFKNKGALYVSGNAEFNVIQYKNGQIAARVEAQNNKAHHQDL